MQKNPQTTAHNPALPLNTPLAHDRKFAMHAGLLARIGCFLPRGLPCLQQKTVNYAV